MIPFTFPSQPSVVSGNAECKVWYLSSVVGMARWIDYIPVRQIATASPIEGRTDAGGYQAVTLLSSISGLAAWTDYIPVYEDSSATVAWGTGADGYIPVGAAGAALSLQMLGSNTLDPRITFTRASSGTHFDSTGTLVTDGNNVARFDYDPVTLAPRGLLIEEQRVNYCLWSEDFGNAVWVKTSGSVTTNDNVAPTGTSIADTFTASAGNATMVQAITTTAVPWTFSVYLKRKTGTGNVDITMDGTTWVTQTINSSTWTRCIVTQTGVVGTSNCGIRLVTSGDAVYVFGGQAE